MHWVITLSLVVVCFATTCKPVVRHEPVSVEQMLSVPLPRMLTLFNEMMERAMASGKFASIRNAIDRYIAKKKVAWLERAFNRQMHMYRGREAAVITMFDSYVNDDVAGIGKTITNIAESASTNEVKRYLKRMRTQVYEMQAAWLRRSETLAVFSQTGADAESGMRKLSSDYRRNLEGVYQTWANKADRDLMRAVRQHTVKTGTPMTADMPLSSFLPTAVAESVNDIRRFIRSIPSSDL